MFSGTGVGRGLTSRHRAPALLETYTFVLLAKFFPTDPTMQGVSLLLISRLCQITVVKIQNGILLSHKNEKIMPFAVAWMELEILI